MGELTRFKYNGAFLIGSRCLYSPESPALNNNIPYIDAFYDEETNMLYTEQNILDGKIEISSVSKMTRVKIQAPEQRNTPIFDKNISVSSSSYIRDTFGIYRPNILAQISGVETPCSFIISPDMFVPHDEFTFLVNRATMFYSTKDYIISFNLYCKALKLYEDNKNNIPYKQSTVAIMHYGLGMILVKLKKLESALQYLEKAQENMPDKTQYSDAVSKYTTGLFSNAVSSSHMTEQELPKCSLNTRKANP